MKQESKVQMDHNLSSTTADILHMNREEIHNINKLLKESAYMKESA